MTKSQLAVVAKKLVRHLPEFRAHSSLLVMLPLRHTLRGILLNRSGDPEAFYATVFIQPLFIRADDLYLNAGWRLGGGTHVWRVDESSQHDLLSEILSKGAPFLRQAESPRDVALTAMSLGRTADPIVVQVMAYSFARASDVTEALQEIDRLLEMLAGDRRPFVRSMFDETAALKTDLLTNVDKVQCQLQDWEQQTAHKLGLTKYLSLSAGNESGRISHR